MNNMKNIVLIGMMGCGKTTISKLLSKKINYPLIDTDEYIVAKFKQTIPEMFEISEKYFRERETSVCKELSNLSGTIISTGGGIILNSLNIDYLKKNGIIIFIDRPIDNIVNDVDIASRPLLKEGVDKVYELYKQRYNLYLNACDIHLINDGSLDDIIEKLIVLTKQI